jgi:Xaa-Pro aminopeptidase
MNIIIKKRISKLKEELDALNLDAAVIMDRENIIYFSMLTDIEAGSIIIPRVGDPVFICLWLDARHVREVSGMNVIPYFFPEENISKKTADVINGLGIDHPRLGFTRYFISLKDFQCLRDFVPGVYFGDIAETCYKIRSIKDENEIGLISRAAEFCRLGMAAAMDFVKPGVRETDVLAEAEYAMRKAGSEGPSFRMQVLRHDRQQLVHPYAGEYYLNDNEPVVIHLGATYKGYTAKMCRTVFLGNVKAETKKIYNVLRRAQELAIEAAKPGATAGEVYEAAFKEVHDNGYAKLFLPTIGYGVGIRQSEFYPIISKNSDQILQENMVIDLLLPTIYLANVGGPRITDTILVKMEGCTNLTGQ